MWILLILLAIIAIVLIDAEVHPVEDWEVEGIRLYKEEKRRDRRNRRYSKKYKYTSAGVFEEAEYGNTSEF